MKNQYCELQIFIPGKGHTTLWRGRTYRQAITQRSNNALRFFKGRKVQAIESTSSRSKPLGWLMEVNHG